MLSQKLIFFSFVTIIFLHHLNRHVPKQSPIYLSSSALPQLICFLLYCTLPVSYRIQSSSLTNIHLDCVQYREVNEKRSENLRSKKRLKEPLPPKQPHRSTADAFFPTVSVPIYYLTSPMPYPIATNLKEKGIQKCRGKK